MSTENVNFHQLIWCQPADVILHSEAQTLKCGNKKDGEHPLRSASPVFVGQHALAPLLWIHVVDEQLAVGCGHQQPWKLLDPDKGSGVSFHFGCFGTIISAGFSPSQQ